LEEARSICYSTDSHQTYGFEQHPEDFDEDIQCYSKVITSEIMLSGFWYEICDEFANSWEECVP